jgi:hypothetical protein
MTKETAGHLIVGLTHNGHKFRPSDWVERIASVFARFDADQRLRYNPQVMPVYRDGMYCLFVASSLASQDPAGYQFVMEFVHNYQLQIKSADKPEQQPVSELSNVA